MEKYKGRYIAALTITLFVATVLQPPPWPRTDLFDIIIFKSTNFLMGMLILMKIFLNRKASKIILTMVDGLLVILPVIWILSYWGMKSNTSTWFTYKHIAIFTIPVLAFCVQMLIAKESNKKTQFAIFALAAVLTANYLFFFIRSSVYQVEGRNNIFYIPIAVILVILGLLYNKYYEHTAEKPKKKIVTKPKASLKK